jgi:hypothetical protein
MNDRFQMDPDEVRSTADQEHVYADGLDEAGIPPYDWLVSFLDNYGKIAWPVKNALDRYYAKRQQDYNALADQHRYTGDALRAFVRDMQHTDEDGSHAISNVFNDGPSGPGAAPLTPGPSGPGPLAGGPNGSMPIDPVGNGATPGADGADPTGSL